jgi:hypothetical protein
MADTHTQYADEIDPETLELLIETGIDPAVYLKRQAEMRAWKPDPVEEEKNRRSREELRPFMEKQRAFREKHGSWLDPEDDGGEDLSEAG